MNPAGAQIGDTIIVTGGCGFIGSAVIRYLIAHSDCRIINVDALTYAANPMTLDAFAGAGERHVHVKADIRDRRAMARLFAQHRPRGIIHLAAESHVDRSIDDPFAFVATNVTGTCTLLDAATAYWRGLDEPARSAFRFHHVSTDEVYGSLGDSGAFSEDSPYRPNSPYAASKAASDHFVRAWNRTHGLPVVISNCSNNFGPYQFPEKLIPLIIIKALAGEDLPVYGRGENVRDWLYVDDHASALWTIFQNGRIGACYNVGGDAERRNIDVVTAICDLLDEMRPRLSAGPRRTLITFVADRPGHDFRYAISCDRLKSELGWRATVGFEEGLRATLSWYLDNEPWWRAILDNAYAGERLGLAAHAATDNGGDN